MERRAYERCGAFVGGVFGFIHGTREREGAGEEDIEEGKGENC